MMKWALVVASMMMPGAVMAAEVSFTIHDVTLTATIPAGYCVPSGLDKEATDLAAASDPVNVTHATLIRCDHSGRLGDLGNDALVIKTPRRALALRVSRAEFLRSLSEQFGSANWKSGSKSAEILKEVGDGLSTTAKAPVVLDGGIAPRGSDEDCVYLGGQLIVSANGRRVTTAMGACGTSVGNKLVNVSAYSDYRGSESIIAMMRKAHDLAMSITIASDTAP